MHEHITPTFGTIHPLPSSVTCLSKGTSTLPLQDLNPAAIAATSALCSSCGLCA